MKRQLTFREYRAIDMGMFAIMAVIFEFIVVKVSRSVLFADQACAVSVAGAITTILYMRWGFWGAIHAALMGLLYCFYSKANSSQYIIYIVGNLFSIPAVLILVLCGYEKVRRSQWVMGFPILVILLMQIGRGIVSMVLGSDFDTALGFITTDPLSILFTFVIVWIAKRLDGIFENQKHYLLRVHEEEKRDSQF